MNRVGSKKSAFTFGQPLELVTTATTMPVSSPGFSDTDGSTPTATIGRFIYLQLVLHKHYQTLAESNRIAIVPIAPNRGVITDRNGIVLAQSYSAYTLEIQPSRVKNLDETIDALLPPWQLGKKSLPGDEPIPDEVWRSEAAKHFAGDIVVARDKMIVRA